MSVLAHACSHALPDLAERQPAGCFGLTHEPGSGSLLVGGFQMRKFFLVFVLFGLLIGCQSDGSSQGSQYASPSASASSQPPAQRSSTYFEVAGGVTVAMDDATATLFKNRRNIWALNMVSSPAAVKRLKRTYGVNLFFSRKFDPKPGKYPVQFSYLNRQNTLGGSFTGPRMLFSHDTQGEAEFLEFGDQVKVRFEFTAYDKSEGNEDRAQVTVKGEAVCDRGDAFK